MLARAGYSGEKEDKMSPAIEQQIRKTNQIFEAAVAARDVSRLDAVYTRDARVLPPGAEMVAGQENIKHFWSLAMEALNVGTVRLETLSFEPSGETAYEIGRATLEFATGGSLTVKYVVVWKIEDGD